MPESDFNFSLTIPADANRFLHSGSLGEIKAKVRGEFTFEVTL
jgi:hypothetical protein